MLVDKWILESVGHTACILYRISIFLIFRDIFSKEEGKI